MKCNKQLKNSNYVAFSHFHGTAVNNSGKVIKEDDEQVFMLDEIPKITGYLEQNQDMLNLGILLLFKTGLRIGELAALKNCDIHGNVIHVNRTEICYEEENGNRVYEVRDFPKTEAGIRDVVIPSTANI